MALLFNKHVPIVPITLLHNHHDPRSGTPAVLSRDPRLIPPRKVHSLVFLSRVGEGDLARPGNFWKVGALFPWVCYMLG